jgi:hypothetical protein
MNLEEALQELGDIVDDLISACGCGCCSSSDHTERAKEELYALFRKAYENEA